MGWLVMAEMDVSTHLAMKDLVYEELKGKNWEVLYINGDTKIVSHPNCHF